jgi:hypothetical protein
MENHINKYPVGRYDTIYTLIKNYADARYDNMFHIAVHQFNTSANKQNFTYNDKTFGYLNYAKKINNKAVIDAVDDFLYDKWTSFKKTQKTQANIITEKAKIVADATAEGVKVYKQIQERLKQEQPKGGKRRTKHRKTKSRKHRVTKSRKLRR